MMQPAAAETSAGPLGLIIIAVSVGTMALVFARAFRSRRTAARVRSGRLAAPARGRRPGIAAVVTDAGQIPAQELLASLAVAAIARLPIDPDGDDEGVGAALGLSYHRYRHRGDLWDPTVYDGTRNGHQAFIRLGRNAAVRGPGLNARRLRSLCAVRVAVPTFELVSSNGQLRATAAPPPVIADLLARMQPSPDVWHDLRVVAGPDGLVASRGIAGDWLGGWIYDLWLLERMSALLGGAPLPPEPLGREWTPPYGMGDWAPSVRDTLGGRY